MDKEEMKEDMASIKECVFGILSEMRNVNNNIELLIKTIAAAGLAQSAYFPSIQTRAVSHLHREFEGDS